MDPRCPNCDHLWSEHAAETEHTYGGCRRGRNHADPLRDRAQCLCPATPPAAAIPPLGVGELSPVPRVGEACARCNGDGIVGLHVDNVLTEDMTCPICRGRGRKPSTPDGGEGTS